MQRPLSDDGLTERMAAHMQSLLLASDAPAGLLQRFGFAQG